MGPRRYDVFFSYNSADARVVEPFAEALRSTGLSVFLDRWYLAPGGNWMSVLEDTLASCSAVAVFVSSNGLGPWQQKESQLAMERQTRDPAFRVIPVILTDAEPPLGFLRLNTWIDARGTRPRDDAVGALVDAVRNAIPADSAIDFKQRFSPYRGLRPFREEDAPFFFGRDVFARQLAGTVQKKQFVTVVGPSGSGKSSVVRAGLIPRLRRRLGNAVWEVVVMRPGQRPFESLAEALQPLLKPKTDANDGLTEIGTLAGQLRLGHISLGLALRTLLKLQPGTDRLLLVVDQWEELFTLSEASVREAFTSAILDALDDVPLSVVTTIRGDFIEHMLANRRLSDRLTVEHIGPVNDDEQRMMIQEPAREVGVAIEPGLVERILDDLRESSEGLPLLEFVVTQLWERRSGGALSHRDYDAIGRVAGAIATHANDELGQLTADQQAIAKKIFLRLVQTSAGELAKRPCAFSDLPAGSAEVVRKLADARLLVTSVKAGSDERIIELAHEALIRQWKQFAAWIDEEKTFLVWRDRLRVDIERWEESRRSFDQLLRGRTLSEAKRWRKSHGDQLSDAERDFIRRSDRFFKMAIGSLAAVLAALGIYAGVVVWIEDRKTPDTSAVTTTTPTSRAGVTQPDYGVLAGRVMDSRHGTSTDPHYQIKVAAGRRTYRVAVNLRSIDSGDMLCAVKNPFRDRKVLTQIDYVTGQGDGLSVVLAPEIGLDYIRGGFVSRSEMRPCPLEQLNDILDSLVTRTQREGKICVFGTPWQGEHPEEISGFKSSNGVHNVHMNQGLSPPYYSAMARDGALLFRFGDGHWAAVFLAYQNQSWKQ